MHHIEIISSSDDYVSQEPQMYLRGRIQSLDVYCLVYKAFRIYILFVANI